MRFFTKGTTGLVAVTDVTKAMFQLMKSDSNGERFVLVAEVMSFEKLLKIIADSLQLRAPAIHAKPWLTSVYWRIDWLLSVLLQRKRKYSKIMAHSLHQISDYSNEKIRSEFDFEFQNMEAYLIETGHAFPKK